MNKKKTIGTTKKNGRNGKQRTIRRKNNRLRINRKTRRIQRRFSMKGGIVLGKGKYGVVIGNPRLKCKIQEDGHSKTNREITELESQVSKLFISEEDAEKEFGVLERLKGYGFDTSKLNELKKYAVLPLQKCIIDKKSFESELLKNKEEDRQRLMYMYNSNLKYYSIVSQVTYPKGNQDLVNVYVGRSIEGLKSFVNKTQNILSGLQLLHINGFNHGDIKLGNCVEFSRDEAGDTGFRIIDMASVEHIAERYYYDKMPISFRYYIWPTITVYTYFFNVNVPDEISFFIKSMTLNGNQPSLIFELINNGYGTTYDRILEDFLMENVITGRMSYKDGKYEYIGEYYNRGNEVGKSFKELDITSLYNMTLKYINSDGKIEFIQYSELIDGLKSRDTEIKGASILLITSKKIIGIINANSEIIFPTEEHIESVKKHRIDYLKHLDFNMTNDLFYHQFQLNEDLNQLCIDTLKYIIKNTFDLIYNYIEVNINEKRLRDRLYDHLIFLEKTFYSYEYLGKDKILRFGKPIYNWDKYTLEGFFKLSKEVLGTEYDLAKEKLLKRIDLYSYGILLLFKLNTFIEINEIKTEDELSYILTLLTTINFYLSTFKSLDKDIEVNDYYNLSSIMSNSSSIISIIIESRTGGGRVGEIPDEINGKLIPNTLG